MIQHLPKYLRKIIEDFHESQHSGALHRFWIEAEEIDISLADEEVTQNDTSRIGVNELKMLVKKHRMERDIHGELKDISNDDEGWPIYVLTREQLLELEQGRRVIEGHAMIFIHLEAKLLYWDDNKIIRTYVPEDYRESLLRLYIQPKELNGKVSQNTKNMPLIYRITKEMAQQTELPHRYSPEFIFAHEFTTHYNEFAQYLPEFGRLRELSKLSALIRFLNGIRASNQASLQALDSLLKTSSPNSPPDTDIYRQYRQSYQKTCQNITSLFQDWRRTVASSILQKKWHEELTRIKNQIGTFTFSAYSTEVNEACQRWHDEVSKENPRVSSSRIWSEVVNPKRSDIAKKLSESKQQSCRNQLHDIFSPQLLATLGASAFKRLIDSFMQGESTPIANALIIHEKAQAQQEIIKRFPNRSARDIALAIDDAGDVAAMRIAIEESKDQLRQQKVFKDKLELGFVQINFGKQEATVDLKEKCFWVPASVHHEVRKDDTTGLTRYSFFVYGGVNIQPRINIVQGRNAPLGGSSIGGGAFSSVNAQVAMNNKLQALQKAQNSSVRTEKLEDGRIRYYAPERQSQTFGPTRGNAHVTEHNIKTGQVRAWAESYDHQGNVTRVHPKMIDGQKISSLHYPPTGSEISQIRGSK